MRIDAIKVALDEAGDLTRRKTKLDHTPARTVAALVGTLPAALGIGIALAWALPLPGSLRYVIASFGVPLLWVVTSCRVFLAPSGKRAWLEVLVTLVAAGALALVASLVRTGVPFWA